MTTFLARASAAALLAFLLIVAEGALWAWAVVALFGACAAAEVLLWCRGAPTR